MGFLNHATNNIIIDAVLTERGREKLSEGNFNINYFAFADDEVDYTNITKYGPIVGKEKIEKNTPIFEASTNENIGIKYKLINMSSGNLRLLYLPVFNISATRSNATIDMSGPIEINFPTREDLNTGFDATFKQTFVTDSENEAIPNELKDTAYLIKVNNDLLELSQVLGNTSSTSLQTIDLDQNNIATYRITAQSSVTGTDAARNLTEASFTVKVKSTASTNIFSRYSRANDSTKIDTTIQVIGNKTNTIGYLSITIIRPTDS